ncbi:MAG TPA: hypothetical protein PLZ36_01905 [Armatimonadota bacterium]|nr:hypothetical protein [Armatimonadota bacterium]
MTLLEAIGAWFAAQEFGEVGVDLFLQERPSRPVGVTALYLDGGEAEVSRPVRRVRLRCAVRAESAHEALEGADAIFDRLHGRENFPLDDGWWCYLAAGATTPALAGRAQPEGGGPGMVAECGFVLVVRALASPPAPLP